MNLYMDGKILEQYCKLKKLYMSSSQTAGAQRPTLSFLKDKIRFLGD